MATQRQALTALSTGTGTAILTEHAAADPTSRDLATGSEPLLPGGGMPLVVENEAIGVGGPGGAADDERRAAEATAREFGKTGERP